MDLACQAAGPLAWHDRKAGVQTAQPGVFGDIVLARKDTPTSYHLAVTLDDAAQDITLVTRGSDLFAASHVHRLLQALLNLPVPEWHHHRLICDAQGQRLAKRDEATSLRSLRHQGVTPDSIRDRLGIARAEWPGTH
jgi:glutamyl-Q tRNA(Asp) synthetase